MPRIRTARIENIVVRSALISAYMFILSFLAWPMTAAAVSLTIGDGVIIQAGKTGQLVVRDTLITSKSTLTSSSATPAPGDWLGLLVLGSSSGTSFTGTRIEFAAEGALQVRGASPTISGIDIRNSGTGIKLSNGAAPQISASMITGNSVGIDTSNGAHPTVSNSFLAGNTFALQNVDQNQTITATGNWWGHPSGPQNPDTNAGGLGSPVSNFVTFSPWSAVVPLLGTSFSIAQGSTTESTDITLNLSCNTCTDFMASESSTFTNATYQPFVTQAPFSLSAGDASKTVYVRFRTSTGNTSNASATVRLDTVGPTLTVATPAAGSTIGRPITIAATASDLSGVAKVEFYIDNALVFTDTTNAYSYAWNILAAPDGGHELKTVAYDTMGHTSTDTRTVTVSKVPPTAPVITSPAAMSTSLKTINVSGTAEAGISVSLYINGNFGGQTVANQAGLFLLSGAILAEGSNSLTVAASDSLGSSPRSDAVLITVDSGPPPPPTIYSSTSLPGGSVKLSWSPDIAEVPAHYNLYRGTAPFTTTAGATLLNNSITATSYTDLPPADGTYYYGLTSVDAAGNESLLSARVTVSSDRTPPTAAVVFSQPPPFGPNSGVINITLTLSEPLSAPPYLGIAPAGDIANAIPLNPSASATEWSGTYTVTGTTPHGVATIVFAGKDLTGNKGSQLTSGATFQIDTRGPGGALQFIPSSTVYKAGTVAVTLTLDEPATQTPTLQFTPPVGPVVPVSLSGNGTSWSGTLSITTGMGDGTGRFTVATLDGFGNSGSTLTAGSSIALDVTPPVAPTGLSALAAAGGSIKLTWNTVADATGYRVYRGATEATELVGSPTVASHNDLPTGDGSYHYKVTAVDLAGNESTLSNDVIAVSDRVPPGAPTVGQIEILASKAVQLSWSAHADGAAVFYRIYRATTSITSVSGLSPLKTVLASAVTTTDTPTTDATYYYAVTALDAAGNESTPAAYPAQLYNFSPPAITVTGITHQQFSPGPVTPAITVTSAGATIPPQVLLLDGAPFISGTAVGIEGPHQLHIEATDASARTTVKDVAFTIDLTDPVVTIDNIVEGSKYEIAVTPLITASDTNLDHTVITLNGSPYIAGTPISGDGPRTLRVEAIDKAGRSTAKTVNFTLDTAPPPPASLNVTATQGASAQLSWSASPAADLAGYLVYKNGVKLTSAPQTAMIYTDITFDSDALQTYRVTAIDATGHEGEALTADLQPVKAVLKNYGRPNGSDFILSKQFIESIKVDLVNGSNSAITLSPVSFKLQDNQGTVTETVQSTPIPLGAGSTVSTEKVLSVSGGSLDSRTYSVTMTLPSSPNVTVKRTAGFSLNAFDPGRKIEIFNDPLVKGATTKVRLKIFNHGSAPMELLTSSTGKPTADIYVLLKDQDGNVLVNGNLNQQGAGVINYGGTYALAEVAPGGSFLSAPIEIIVPSTAPGTMYLYAYVKNIYYHYNRADQLTAGDFSGYTTVTAGLPPYTATISSDLPTYDQRVSSAQLVPSIVLSGDAINTSDGSPAANMPIKIGIGVKGFDRYLYAQTDANGHYSTTFIPLVGEAGNYTLWATYPAVADKPIQAGFTIFGMGFEPRSVNLRMSKNSSFSMPLTLRNLGESDLTGLQFSLIGGPGITGTLDLAGTAAALIGGNSTSLRMTLNAALDAPDASSASIVVTSSQGISRTMDVSIALLTALPTITTDPAFIEAGINRNSSKVVTFRLKNIGYAPLENIVIVPPELPWIGLLSGTTLPNLPAGSSVDISVNFRPTDAVAQGVHADKLVITSGNHVPYTLNLFPTVISTDKGSLHFLVTDSLAKKVNGASIAISHQQLGSVYLTGTADANGEASFNDIVEGMYNYKVQAPGHEVVIGTVEVTAGSVVPVEIFMNNVFVTFDWSVTPMTLTDKYDVQLLATFETQVPAPVLTIDPAYDKLELERGSTFVGEYRVTNHGLVAMDDVKINMGGGPGVVVESMMTELPRIGAMETIIIPYRITLLPSSSTAAVQAPAAAPSMQGRVAAAPANAGPEPGPPGCSTIPMTVNVGGTYTCAAGVPTWGGVTGTRTIVPREVYDPLGLCDVKCDWCKCLPSAAQSICNCLKSGDACTCLGLVGGEAASVACGCVSTPDPMTCMAEAALNATVQAVKDKIIELTPGIGQAKAALDMAKNIASCLLCVMELIPAIPSSPGATATGSYGGGSYGGMGSVRGGGNGFSSVRVCQ